MKHFVAVVPACLLTLSGVAFAHPGRLAADGYHNDAPTARRPANQYWPFRDGSLTPGKPQ